MIPPVIAPNHVEDGHTVLVIDYVMDEGQPPRQEVFQLDRTKDLPSQVNVTVAARQATNHVKGHSIMSGERFRINAGLKTATRTSATTEEIREAIAAEEAAE